MTVKKFLKILLAISTLFLSSLASAEEESWVEITSDKNYRYISANGLPNHQTGKFPKRNCPNAISEQNYSFKVPLNPQLTGRITSYGFSDFGVALNGVVFDPKANEFWNGDRSSGWNYNPASSLLDNFLGLDQNNAHVQPNGAYHYHGIPNSLVAQEKSSPLVGYAADGFPIYAIHGYDKFGTLKALKPSYHIKSGIRPSGPGKRYDGTFIEDYEYVSGLGDLDECNGTFGKTAEYPKGTYFYVITKDFPYVPRCFKGTPDPSFSKRPKKHDFERPFNQQRP